MMSLKKEEENKIMSITIMFYIISFVGGCITGLVIAKRHLKSFVYNPEKSYNANAGLSFLSMLPKLLIASLVWGIVVVAAHSLLT